MPVNHYLGENFPNNPNLSTIEEVMSAGRLLINDYDERNYVGKAGLVCTVRSYVQVLHTYFGKTGKQKGVVLHAPLCKDGLLIYIWKEKHNRAPKEYQLLHIPFGSILVLDGRVVHGDIVGSPGNVHFHVKIILRCNVDISDKLEYTWSKKQQNSQIAVDYKEAISILPEEKTSLIQNIILYIKSTFANGGGLLKPFPSGK